MEGIWDEEYVPETSENSRKSKRKRGACDEKYATSTLEMTENEDDLENAL